MKSRKASIDWMLFATAGIFLMVGKFIAPRYESMLLESGIVEEVTPISTYCMIAGGFFALILVLRWILRFRSGGG